MSTSDFYLINLSSMEWIASTIREGEPIYIPYEVVIQNDEINYLFELENFILHSEDGVIQRDGWPHQYEDSRLTDYVYYFFNSMGRVLFSLGEEQHRVLYDPIEIKKGLDLKSAKVLNFNRGFPKMKLIAKV